MASENASFMAVRCVDFAGMGPLEGHFGKKRYDSLRKLWQRGHRIVDPDFRQCPGSGSNGWATHAILNVQPVKKDVHYSSERKRHDLILPRCIRKKGT
jgi:hypothetical protein